MLAAAAIAGGFYFHKKSRSSTQKYENSGLLPSTWLIKYFGTDRDGDPKIGGVDGDPDQDLLTNYQEFYFGTDPTRRDTDGDGQLDGVEVAVNQNPTGPGELYSTDYAKTVADKFMKDNGLEEFKEENIKKQVLGIMSPPNAADVKVELPDVHILTVSNNTSQEAIEQYFTKVDQATIGLEPNLETLQAAMENPDGQEATIQLGQANEIVDKLRAIAVPSPLLTFHQLHIAGLLAASQIFEEAKKINETAELESQKEALSKQTYHFALVQKINEMSSAEFARLMEKYKNE